MKVALCFSGIVGGIKGKNGKGQIIDPSIAAKTWKDNFLSINDTDVFFHTWSVDQEDKLLDLYDPKRFISEKQMDFTDGKRGSEAWRSASRWYGTKQVIELKKSYEREKNFKYDAVILSRFDMMWFTKVDLSKYDMKYWYASNWNDSIKGKNSPTQPNRANHFLGQGFLDLWFFSNSHFMDKFGTLYDHRKSYSPNPHIASYQHTARVIYRGNIRYTMYRWYDFEIVRRKVYMAHE